MNPVAAPGGSSADQLTRATSVVDGGVWVAVCAVDDVPLGEGRNVTVHGRRLAIFRTAAGVFATAAACPHKGGPLADGIVADSCVTCPLHGRRFDLATGAVTGGGHPVAVFETRVDDSSVMVLMPE